MIPKNDFRIVFMGTPDFAVASLKKLIDHGYTVAGVVTNPDKPAGRGRQLKESPVKILAKEKGLPILQPTSLKDESFARELEALRPSLQIVVAFKILPERIFTIPTHGTFNLHASLLPDYRGAAPINRAIMNGETTTGVTTFFLDPSVDTGKIIKWKKTTIDQQDNAGSLHERLMTLGAELVVETTEAIRTGNYEATDQSQILGEGRRPKKAPKIFREDCRINWWQSTHTIYNFIRGLSPYPAAWTRLQNGREITLKVYRAGIEKRQHGLAPGSIDSDRKSYIKVAVSDGFVRLEELQQQGKKKMPVTEFLKGFPNITDYHCE